MNSGVAKAGYDLPVDISSLQILGQQQTSNDSKRTINNHKQQQEELSPTENTTSFRNRFQRRNKDPTVQNDILKRKQLHQQTSRTTLNRGTGGNNAVYKHAQKSKTNGLFALQKKLCYALSNK
ncbi:MAG: hypothetical protein BA871_08985 [Desulfuromonadales bacterium C00003096]|jgi:hypothetical protein|nr:MAG: hypothetical protein BA871_08985 [Desulfuromonadales bacterium C00003096]